MENENRTSGGGVDDGPRFMYGNRATYMKYARRMATKLNMSVEDWIMDMEHEFGIDDRDVVDTVSYFPTGDPHTNNAGTDYHPEVSSKEAHSLWAARAEKIAKVANLDITVVDTIDAEESKKEPIAEGVLKGSDGKPLTVYHSTRAKFDNFKNGALGANFFTPYKATAKMLGMAFSDSIIIAANISFKNPKIVQASKEDGLWDANFDREQIELAKQEGHDGVIFKNKNDEVEYYAAMNPNQIKRIKTEGLSKNDTESLTEAKIDIYPITKDKMYAIPYNDLDAFRDTPYSGEYFYKMKGKVSRNALQRGDMTLKYRTGMDTGKVDIHFSIDGGNIPENGKSFTDGELTQYQRVKFSFSAVDGDLEEIARTWADIITTVRDKYPFGYFKIFPPYGNPWEGYRDIETAAIRYTGHFLYMRPEDDGFRVNEIQFNPVEGGYMGYINEHFNHIDIGGLLCSWEEQLVYEHKGITHEEIDIIIESNLVNILDEKTYKDLRRDAPHYLRIRDKSKKTPGSRFTGIDEHNVCHFKTPSHTHAGVTYDQQVRLLDLEKLIQTQSGIKKPLQIIRMALQGNIEVHCTDPSWKYWGFQYIGTKDKYAMEKEPRYPKIRNPRLKGSVCKHLDNVLFVLPFQNTKILKDLRSQQRL